jgi:CRP/FNR family transcriptional regulator
MEPCVRTFKTGALLFREDDRSRELYIIQSGRVRVFRIIGHREVELAVLGKGAVLGEMALIDGKPRSASAAACEESSVVMIDTDTFAKRVGGVPSWYMSMIRTTSEKIRKANARLEAIRTANHNLHVVLALEYHFFRYGSTGGGEAKKSLELATTVRQCIQLLSVSHQAIMTILDMLHRNSLVDVKNNRIALLDEPRFGLLCTYLRFLFRKAFEKMPVVSRNVQAIVTELGTTAAARQSGLENGSEIPGADMLAALSKADEEPSIEEALELREFGILTVEKTGDKSVADKENPLAGYTFHVAQPEFKKYFLYCSCKDMVPTI